MELNKLAVAVYLTGWSAQGGTSNWVVQASNIAKLRSIPTPQPTVPEPGTLVLLGLGIPGLGASRRRKA